MISPLQHWSSALRFLVLFHGDKSKLFLAPDRLYDKTPKTIPKIQLSMRGYVNPEMVDGKSKTAGLGTELRPNGRDPGRVPVGGLGDQKVMLFSEYVTKFQFQIE